MAKFNAKSFNENVFGFYSKRVPRQRLNQLIKSKVIKPSKELADLFHNATGSCYATRPFYGSLEGAAQNSDGQTNIIPTSSTSYEQGVVCVGRMKAWVEKDFAEDVTNGAGFMDNVAAQVVDYFDELDQDTILSIVKGIFAMTSTKGQIFAAKHTYDLSTSVDGITETTLNTAMQKACGDKKRKFSVVAMHSTISTKLENLNLIAHLKYTDKDGMTREIEMGTWNGRLVVIDDAMPVEEAVTTQGTKGVYTLTISTKGAVGDKITIDNVEYKFSDSTSSDNHTIAVGSTYSTQASELKTLLENQFEDMFDVAVSSNAITLTQREEGIGAIPSVEVINASSGTLVASITTTIAGVADVKEDVYTTYVFGEGFFEFADCAVEHPHEMVRDALTNGGQDTLIGRQRKAFAPYGISYTKKVQTSLSPTDEELENGANWDLVNDGNGKTIDMKSIPVARIISKG